MDNHSLENNFGKSADEMVLKAGSVFSMERHFSLAQETGAEFITIGSSTKDRPLIVLKKGNGKFKVLFIARIHGNEPATTQAMLEFFKENDFEEVTLYGIFLANPDGAALYEEFWKKNSEPHWQNNCNDARLNSKGVDINRDWLDLSQKETQAIQKFILSLRPDFTVDFHEYYWADQGYPPKLPTDDADGFMATMTDAPFYGTDDYVRTISERAMNSLIKKMKKEFSWKIKPRHFIGETGNTYDNPTFLGIYLALRGIPKLLIETWGVACSTLLLDKRILFHKLSMKYLIEWLEANRILILKKPDTAATLQFNLMVENEEKVSAFSNKLDLHSIDHTIDKNKNITIRCRTLEIGFVKTIHYLIFEKGSNQ